MDSARHILSVLDDCCASFSFPMLDNGYIYLAATRLSLFRSTADWAMVIEVFGFSPRAGLPDTHVHTFGSRLHNRDAPEKYRDRKAYENYLANHPHNDSRFFFPIGEDSWQDPDNQELVDKSANQILLRGHPCALPPISAYKEHGIDLQESHQVHVFELCRFLAATTREQVLASEQERRVSVLPEMEQTLQLAEWRHPDLVNSEPASACETFRQLAEVLSTGDLDLYRPSASPNTDWRNWPGGGTL
jgi:hypothetical protein